MAPSTIGKYCSGQSFNFCPTRWRTDKHRQLEPRSDSLGEQNTKLFGRVKLRLALTLFRGRYRTHWIFRDVLLPLRRVQRVRQQIMMLDDRMTSFARSVAR